MKETHIKIAPKVKNIESGLARITYLHRTFETFQKPFKDGYFVREIHQFPPLSTDWGTGSYKTRREAIEEIQREVDRYNAHVTAGVEMLEKGKAAHEEMKARRARNASEEPDLTGDPWG